MEKENDTWLYVIGAVIVLLVVVVVFKRHTGTNPANNVPDFNAGSAEWIAWHKQLLKYGIPKEDANALWLKAFNQYAKDQQAANDYALRDYAQTQGMQVQDYSVLSGTYDFGIDTGKSISKAGGTIGTMFAFGVFFFVVILLGAGYLAFKNSQR